MNIFKFSCFLCEKNFHTSATFQLHVEQFQTKELCNPRKRLSSGSSDDVICVYDKFNESNQSGKHNEVISLVSPIEITEYENLEIVHKRCNENDLLRSHRIKPCKVILKDICVENDECKANQDIENRMKNISDTLSPFQGDERSLEILKPYEKPNFHSMAYLRKSKKTLLKYLYSEATQENLPNSKNANAFVEENEQSLEINDQSEKQGAFKDVCMKVKMKPSKKVKRFSKTKEIQTSVLKEVSSSRTEKCILFDIDNSATSNTESDEYDEVREIAKFLSQAN